MAQRARRGKQLRRETARRPEKRTIVVFTEGKRSEPDYVNGMKGLPAIARNVALNIELHPRHGVPATLVDFAIERSRDPEVDECWCLFDVEWPRNHPHLNRVVALAGGVPKVHLAISNPCFELWLVLHHQEYSAFSNTADIEKLSRRLDGRSGKGIDVQAYLPLRAHAARRARELDLRHERHGTRFPADNPSSGMYRFLSSLEPDDT